MYKNIIDSLRNKIANMQVLDIYLDNNKISNCSEKTNEKLQKETVLKIRLNKCFYNNDKKIITLQYNKITKNNNYFESLDFTFVNEVDLKETLNKQIAYDLQYIELTKKTIKDQVKIKKTLSKIIELTKSLNYTEYNSEIVSEIWKSLEDSYLLPTRLV